MFLKRYSSLLLVIFVWLLFSIGCQPRDLTTPIAEAETRATPVPGTTITIAAVGDIMLGSTSINETFLPPNDGRDILKPVTPILSAADIAFGNLEGPMLEGGKSEKCVDTSSKKDANAAPLPSPSPTPAANAAKPIRCFAFRVPSRYGKYLKEAGFDVMSLANNHASDFGDLGRESTRKTLDALGIKYAGSDRGKFSTAILEVKGVRVAVIGFAHNAIVPNVNEIDAAKQLVVAAKKKADLVIVSFHGGAEGEGAQNVPKQTEIFAGEKRGNLPLFAHSVIDAGADLVLGHGPHVLRGMETYKGKLIAYSMGNFATYGMFNLKGAQGIAGIFQITLSSDGKFVSGKIIPTRQEGRGGPVPDAAGTAIKKLRQLSALDFGAAAPTIDDDGSISMK
jgi:poly-gamma-glutamate capsule biosynthesis protein CapA/YwtB (metallophosphatase superfamily)